MITYASIREADEVTFFHQQVGHRQITAHDRGECSPEDRSLPDPTVTKEPSVSRAFTDIFHFIQHPKCSKSFGNTTTWNPNNEPYPLILRVVHPLHAETLRFTTLQNWQHGRFLRNAEEGGHRSTSRTARQIPSLRFSPRRHLHEQRKKRKYPVALRQ